jgi:hypothetical protein
MSGSILVCLVKLIFELLNHSTPEPIPVPSRNHILLSSSPTLSYNRELVDDVLRALCFAADLSFSRLARWSSPLLGI